MSRTLIGCALVAWVGVTLLLADTRWARRLSLTKRLTVKDAPTSRSSDGTGQWLARGATTVGVHMARVLGVHDDLATRLERVHSSLDSTAVRLRQVGWCIGGFALGLLVSAAVGATPGLAVLLTLAPAALGFLLVEHRVTQASDAWRQRVASELPVIAEQLAMLLGAGYALGPALGRLADRGQGACAQDLRRVLTRVAQGLATADALREWSDVVDVSGARRLVAVLALDRETTDLGRLVSEEASAIEEGSPSRPRQPGRAAQPAGLDSGDRGGVAARGSPPRDPLPRCHAAVRTVLITSQF